MAERMSPEFEDPFLNKEEVVRRYVKEPQSSLGEVVVTDPRDPFVWLNTENLKPHEPPSANGKQLLWLMYRMSGNFPKTEQDVKWRDERDDLSDIIKNISQVDYVFFQNYKAHLMRLDAEAALNSHDRRDAFALAAIVQHLKHIQHEQ